MVALLRSFPEELTFGIFKEILDIVKHNLVIRLKTTGQGINYRITTGCDAVPVRATSGHGPVDSSAQVAGVNAAGKKSGDQLPGAYILDLVILVDLHASVDCCESAMQKVLIQSSDCTNAKM